MVMKHVVNNFCNCNYQEFLYLDEAIPSKLCFVFPQQLEVLEEDKLANFQLYFLTVVLMRNKGNTGT